jgi:hypothetical protein
MVKRICRISISRDSNSCLLELQLMRWCGVQVFNSSETRACVFSVILLLYACRAQQKGGRSHFGAIMEADLSRRMLELRHKEKHSIALPWWFYLRICIIRHGFIPHELQLYEHPANPHTWYGVLIVARILPFKQHVKKLTLVLYRPRNWQFYSWATYCPHTLYIVVVSDACR